MSEEKVKSKGAKLTERMRIIRACRTSEEVAIENDRVSVAMKQSRTSKADPLKKKNRREG